MELAPGVRLSRSLAAIFQAIIPARLSLIAAMSLEQASSQINGGFTSQRPGASFFDCTERCNVRSEIARVGRNNQRALRRMGLTIIRRNALRLLRPTC